MKNIKSKVGGCWAEFAFAHNFLSTVEAKLIKNFVNNLVVVVSSYIVKPGKHLSVIGRMVF